MAENVACKLCIQQHLPEMEEKACDEGFGQEALGRKHLCPKDNQSPGSSRTVALCSIQTCRTAQKWRDEFCASALDTTNHRTTKYEWAIITPQGTQTSFIA